MPTDIFSSSNFSFLLPQTPFFFPIFRNKTMKQKVVIKVSMHCQKSRTKALKIAVGVSGVDSAALKGEDKSQIEITGDGMDAVALTTLLRKKVGYAELVSVAPADGNKDENEPQMVCTYQDGVPPYGFYVATTTPYHEPYNCCIL